MKKLFIFLALLSSAYIAKSQNDDDKRFYISLGGDIGTAVGQLHDGYTLGYGGTVKGELRLFKYGLLTATTGYMRFNGRSYYGSNIPATGYVPAKLGFKLDLKQVYIEPQAGTGYFSQEDILHPAVALLIGVPLDQVDLSIRYESVLSADDGPYSFIAARVAIRF